jgi:phosphatidylserine/phosphatidylglycerophosphate/cardiolipin synthase-like enzyme
MEEVGIPIAWEESTAFLHSKFAIIDQSIVWMGSWNFTTNGTYRNNNNLIRFTIPAVVANYEAEFSQMAAGVFGNDKESLAPYPYIQADAIAIENRFSPQDRAADSIVQRVLDAEQSIRFLTFSYTSDPIAEAMVERHQAGVLVQGVFETRNAGGIGSEQERLRDNGIEALEDGNCYTMHHKVIIIDEETVITGSYNFTRRAEETNDENFVIIDDPTIASQYLEEFERVYDQALHPTRCGR